MVHLGNGEPRIYKTTGVILGNYDKKHQTTGKIGQIQENFQQV